MKRYASTILTLVMSAAFVAAYGEASLSKDLTQTSSAPNQIQEEFKNLNDRFSYAYGADLAEKFKAEGIELNAEILATAIQDVYSGGDRKMPAGEVSATLGLYFELHRKRKEEERLAAGKKNKRDGEKFLAQNATREGVLITESGLQYKVIAEGRGGHKPRADDLVTVHYRGMHIDGSEFDNTYQRNEPFSGKVNKFIPAWIEALRMMSEGSKWELYVPADLAYGDRGSEPHIGPNAALVFEVELLEIEKAE